MLINSPGRSHHQVIVSFEFFTILFYVFFSASPLFVFFIFFIWYCTVFLFCQLFSLLHFYSFFVSLPLLLLLFSLFSIVFRQHLFPYLVLYTPTTVGSVYDYTFLWETKKWVLWMKIIEKFEVDPKLSFSEIIVPTTDSVRNTYLLDLLLSNDKHVLCVGGTGTGKTVNISQYLMGAAKIQGASRLYFLLIT